MIQQVCAAALLFTIPNILSKEAFAETVFVAVLFAALGLSDLGLSKVYTRVVPRLIAAGDRESISRWDAMVVACGTIFSGLFAATIVGLYLWRGGDPFRAVLLFPVPVLTFWGTFHATRASMRGDFAEYRNFIGVRAAAGLLAIPGSWAAGITGWFLAQFAAALVVVGRIRRRFLEPWGPVDVALFGRSVPEALLLAVAGVASLQMMNFARLYASVTYPAAVIASYGIATSAYQSLAAAVISAFLPVTVDILGRFGENPAAPFERSSAVLRRTCPPVLVLALVGAEAAPYMLAVAFPSYRLDPATIVTLVAGVAFFPFFVCWGNCLIGMRRTGTYVAVIALAMGLGTLLAGFADLLVFPRGAALGQCALLAFYPGLLVTAVLLRRPHAWSPLRPGICLYGGVLVVTIGYTLLHAGS